MGIERPGLVFGDLGEENSEEGGAGETVVLGEDHVGDTVDYEYVFLARGYAEECVVLHSSISQISFWKMDQYSEWEL